MEYNTSINASDSQEETTPYLIGPPAMFKVHLVIVLVGFMINALHVTILTRITFSVGRHFKLYLLAIGVDDMMAFLFRSLLTNSRSQHFLREQKLACAISCVLNQTLLFGHGLLLMAISCDRVNAFSDPTSYGSSLMVRHCTPIIVMAHVLPVLVCSTYGALVYPRAFSVKGIGGCRIETTIAPNLSLPFSVMGLLVLLSITGNCTYILIRQKRIYTQMSERALGMMQRRAAEVNKTIGLVLILKYTSWLPMLIWVAIRKKSRDCLACNWILIEIGTIINLLFPLAYGLRAKEYKQYVKDKILKCIRKVKNPPSQELTQVPMRTEQTTAGNVSLDRSDPLTPPENQNLNTE